MENSLKRYIQGKHCQTHCLTLTLSLLNYLLLVAKLYLLDYRRRNVLPEIVGLKLKVKTKFEIEKYVIIEFHTLDKFKCKWAIDCNLLLSI